MAGGRDDIGVEVDGHVAVVEVLDREAVDAALLDEACERAGDVGQRLAVPDDEAATAGRDGGEQVAVGSLFASFLREETWLDTLDAAFRRYGVARLPGDLGLTEEEFGAAVALAPSTRPDRYTVLEHLELDEGDIADRVREFVSAFDR